MSRRKPTQAEQMTIVVRKHLAAIRSDKGEPETIADFLTRGGRIERLPGIQPTTVYPPRRPGMNNYRSIGI